MNNSIYRKSKVLKNYCLILIEMICMALAYVLSVWLWFRKNFNLQSQSIYISAGIFMLACTILYSFMTDWNRDFFERGFFRELVAVGKCVVAVALLGNVYTFMTKGAYAYSRAVFLIFPVFDYMFTYVCHLAFKEYMLKYYKKSVNSDKLMIITTSEQAERIITQVVGVKHWNYELKSVAIMDKDMTGSEILGFPVVASRDNLIEYGTQNILDRVFISLPRSDVEDIRNIILEFEAMGVLCHFNIEMPELSLEGKQAGTFAGFSVVSFSLQFLDYRRLMIKRFFDIVGSIIGLVITTVCFPFVAIAIKIESKGPVIFKQERIGKNGRRFYMYKFRSMYIDAEERLKELEEKNEINGLMFKMKDDPRITKVGRFIRKTSIDELPQFLNILKGDMSLVGTRPPTVTEFEKYNAHYRRRLCITPGLTGMWQVSGRSDITDFDEVVKLDLEYIDQWSLLLDVKIIFQTFGAVLFRKGSK